MHTTTNSTCLLLFFFITFFFILFNISLCDPRKSEALLHCGTHMPSPNASFILTFVSEMEALSELFTKNHWGTHLVNSSSTSTSSKPMYGLAQCFDDLSHTDCLLCFAACCIPSLSAAIFLDGCFLRYDTYNFYDEVNVKEIDTVVCGEEEVTSGDDVAEVMERVVENINGGFGVAEVGGGDDVMYGLGQCWESVGEKECRECLRKGGEELVRECGVKKKKREGRALHAGCYLSYSTTKFYSDRTQLDHHHHHGWFTERRGLIISVVLSVVAFTMLSLFAAYAFYTKLVQDRQDCSSIGLMSISISKYSSLSFKYETLEKATDYFNLSRKIGEGGGGTVFKGTLPSGKTVAVKRLFYNTKQWVDEFFNEVNLISGIQHKHLVKLLGCSIEGPESLLVYEYVPNNSLDQFLFSNRSLFYHQSMK